MTLAARTAPAGCGIARATGEGGDGGEPVFVATFNTDSGSSAACAVGIKRTGHFYASDTSVTIDVNPMRPSHGSAGVRSKQEGLILPRQQGQCPQEFNMANASDAAASEALAQCEAFCGDTAQCTACSVDCPGHIATAAGRPYLSAASLIHGRVSSRAMFHQNRWRQHNHYAHWSCRCLAA